MRERGVLLILLVLFMIACVFGASREIKAEYDGIDQRMRGLGDKIGDIEGEFKHLRGD